ncbi:MAG: D-alanine--D-alanine ligase [Deltaproteobacteria bacterium]|nr:D-alanine--D-alanine ligase [Deltaproteobacteria bacterium]
MKILIVYDKPTSGDNRDISPDHADVLIQVQSVRSALVSIGHEVSEAGFDLNLDAFKEVINLSAPDLIFNLVESVGGRGSLIHLATALFDILNIPYTGSKTDAMYKTSNKCLAKELLRAKNIPTPAYFTSEDLRDQNISLSGEFIIKSVWEHASIGIDDSSIVSPSSGKELLSEMEKRKDALGGMCLAEQYIDGREFNLSMLAGPDGPEVLPPAEIRFISYDNNKRKIVGYDAKWSEETFEYSNTVRSFDFQEDEFPLLDKLRDISKKCWRLFNIGGYCRVDFRVDKANNPFVLEVNANPCISPDAGFMAAAVRAGLNAEDVMKRIIDNSNVII